MTRSRVLQSRDRTFHRRAVTLLEVILALGILVVLSTTTYWFYFASLQSREKELETDRKLQLARTILSRLATEIRQSSYLSKDDRLGVRGEAEEIWLTTVRVPDKGRRAWFSPTDEPPPGQYDVVRVHYKTARHPEITTDEGYEYPVGLARVEVKVPRPLAENDAQPVEEGGDEQAGGETGEEGAEEEESLDPLFASEELFGNEEEETASLGVDVNFDELYSSEIRYLRFCYHDGYQWWDSWNVRGGENPLPQLVMVTIGFDMHAPFGEGFGVTPNEEFCQCLNRDPSDCERLAEDQLSMVVRVPQADPFFRSRVGRETQALTDEMTGGQQEEEEGDTQ